MRTVRILSWCAAAVAPGLVLGVYVRAAGHSRAELAAGIEKGAELDAVATLQRDSAQYQLRLADEVATGRLPLADAAADVLAAGRSRPGWLAALALTFPDDPNDRTRVARVLLNWVKAFAEEDPTLGDEAVERVSAEFDMLSELAGD